MKRKIVACGRACVVKDNKLLLVNNAGKLWYLPGGHMEPLETLAQCAQREVYEETGYTIIANDLLYFYEFYDKDLNHHKLESCFSATVKARPEGEWQDLGHDKSVTMAKFFTLEEIQNLDNVHPVFLKEGKWLEAQAGKKVYMGYEESE